MSILSCRSHLCWGPFCLKTAWQHPLCSTVLGMRKQQVRGGEIPDRAHLYLSAQLHPNHSNFNQKKRKNNTHRKTQGMFHVDSCHLPPRWRLKEGTALLPTSPPSIATTVSVRWWLTRFGRKQRSSNPTLYPKAAGLEDCFANSKAPAADFLAAPPPRPPIPSTTFSSCEQPPLPSSQINIWEKTKQ